MLVPSGGMRVLLGVGSRLEGLEGGNISLRRTVAVRTRSVTSIKTMV